MEKRGDVQPGRTPDVEQRLCGTKTADAATKTERLDDDFTKRAADLVAATTKPATPADKVGF
jgi:hypothetical protein